MHDGDRSGPVQFSILLSSLPCMFAAKVRGVCAVCRGPAFNLSHCPCSHHACAALSCCIKCTWDAATRAGAALLIAVVVPAC